MESLKARIDAIADDARAAEIAKRKQLAVEHPELAAWHADMKRTFGKPKSFRIRVNGVIVYEKK